MESPFSAHPPSLNSGICRANPTSITADLTPFETGLLSCTPPNKLLEVHSPSHLVSFARHLRLLAERPVQKVVISDGPFYMVLGVAVFYRNSDGTYLTATWDRSDDRIEEKLMEFVPWDTAILDFPRTDLWQIMMNEVLVRETRRRTENASLADDWSAWAWKRLKAGIINLLDLRRVRSQVRHGLELDWRTVSLVLKTRRIQGFGRPSVQAYNSCHLDRLPCEEMWRISPLLAVLWAGVIHLPGAPTFELEPTTRLKKTCLELGIKPAQWKLLASSRAPFLPILCSFCREFMGTWHREPMNDFLGLIRLLEPSKALDLSVWRAILSLEGTQNAPAKNYAESLTPIAESLRHVIRLIEQRKCPADVNRRDDDLHQICAWIVDQGIRTISKPQRRQGWQYLVRKAHEYSAVRKRKLELEDMRWAAPIPPISVDAFTAVPLVSGSELWEESIAMRHCADLYGEHCKNGRVLIMSVRLKDGSRYATLAMQLKDGVWSLLQACGPGNKKLGAELAQLIGTILCLLGALRSASSSPASGPRYQVYVFSNYDRDDHWPEGVYFSQDAAVAAAKRVIRDGFESKGAAGRDKWLDFGDTPIIESLGGAPPAGFSASDYVASCVLQVQKN